MYKIVNRKKRWATRLADIAGNVVFLPRRFRQPPAFIAPETVRRILVVRTAYIGDVVMTLPMLAPLRRRFPKAHITFLTGTAAAPLLSGHPGVDEVLTHDPFWFYPRQSKRTWFDYLRMMRGRSFDLIIEARADLRELLGLVEPLRSRYRVSYGVGGGAYLLTHVVPYDRPMHKVDYHLNIARFLGCEQAPIDWGLAMTAAERDQVRVRLNRLGIAGPFVAIHPGSRLPLKQWAPDRFAVVADRIREQAGLPVVWLGTAAERPAVDAARNAMRNASVSLVGELSLRALMRVLAEARMLICNDSGPMHLAVALDTPVVAVFGPSKLEETGPYGSPHRVVERPMTCRATCDENHCRNSQYQSCLRELSVDDVWREVEAGCRMQEVGEGDEYAGM